MKRVLILKEWVGIRWFVWLMAALTVIGLADIAFGSLASLTGKHIAPPDAQWAGQALSILLMAFLLGSGLIAREVEDGTLAFLDGLPVRRRDVFLAKLLVAGGCVFFFCLTGPLIGWLLHVLTRQSIDEQVPLATLGVLLLRTLLVVAAGLGLGLLFGFVRHLAWLLLVIATAVVLLLRTSWPRVAAAIDPTALLADGWATEGMGGDAVTGVALVALVSTLLAYLLFAWAGGAGTMRLARLAQRRAFVACVWGAAIAAFVAAAVFMARDTDAGRAHAGAHAKTQPAPAYEDDEDADDENDDANDDAPPRKVVTAHYTFNIPAGEKIEERALKAAAERAFARAATALSLKTDDLPVIDVDLSGSIDYTDGLALSNRIRLNRNDAWENTLVHETVHVMAEWAAGPARRPELDQLRLFNEGLARWAEPARRAAPARRAREDRAAGTIFRRHLLRQNDVLDAEALERKLDWQMIYPLGAKLIDALTARYGQDAPLRILVTVSKPDFPRGLEGYDLYRTAFQLAGYDINLVLNDYAQELRRQGDAFAAAIDAAPRPRGLLVRDGARTGIAVLLDRPLAGDSDIVVRFRARDDSPSNEYTVVTRLVRRGPHRIAWAPSSRLAGNQACYQVGVDDGSGAVYEPWSCLPFKAAISVAQAK